MRPFEWIVVLGAALMVVGWGAGWRARRALPWFAAAMVVVHLIVEGQRLAMWPAYAIVAIGLIASSMRPAPRQPHRPRWRRVGRGILAVVLLLIAVPLPFLWPVMRLPKPAGPFGIGQTRLVVVDSSRRERFGTDRNAFRRFPVKIWYPAAAGVTGSPAPYSDLREFALPGLPRALFAHLALVKTSAILEAPLAPGDRFPVLVFSHGYGGGYSQNTVQMEELASQGYVVASIAHPGESSWAPFPDSTGFPMDTGLMNNLQRQADPDAMKKMVAMLARFDSAPTGAARLAEFRQFIAAGTEPLRSESVAQWAADTRALVDHLAALDVGGGTPFQGRLDLGRLGVFGMSYGGATAGEFCSQDARCKAAVNIDGGQYGNLVNDSLQVPFLIIASSQAYSFHTPVLELTRAPSFLVGVPETTHMGLTDLSYFAPVLFRWAGLTGRLDSDRRERIMTAYTLGFFETYLKDKRSVLFDGPSAEFPEVSIVKRNTP